MSKKELIIPEISQFSSRKEWEAVCWQKILASPQLLQLITTQHERKDLVMRAAALDRIQSGKSYRQISRELWLSLQTISGIKKALNENHYKSYLERSKKERKRKTYSSNSKPRSPKKPSGISRRTKYGIVYIPRPRGAVW